MRVLREIFLLFLLDLAVEFLDLANYYGRFWWLLVGGLGLGLSGLVLGGIHLMLSLSLTLWLADHSWLQLSNQVVEILFYSSGILGTIAALTLGIILWTGIFDPVKHLKQKG